MSDENIRVFISDIRGFVNAARYNKYAKLMPQIAVKKVNALRNMDAKQRTLGAWSLLLECLKCCEDTQFLRERPEDFRLFNFGEGDHGKPFLKNYSWIHFNLSHSGDYVMCVIADAEVGCDIQKVGKRNEKIATRFFTPAEQAYITDPKDFAQIWARKESVIKMTGRGFAEEFSSFDTTKHEVFLADGTNCYVRDFAIRDEYRCSVCSRRDIFPESIWRVVLI